MDAISPPKPRVLVEGEPFVPYKPEAEFDPRLKPVTVYEILEITLPIEKTSEAMMQQLMLARVADAQMLRRNYKGCASARKAATGIYNVRIGSLLKADGRKLPAPLKAALDKSGPGALLGPARSPGGIQFIGYCGKTHMAPPAPDCGLDTDPESLPELSDIAGPEATEIERTLAYWFRSHVAIDFRAPFVDDLLHPAQSNVELVRCALVVERVRGSVDDRHDQQGIVVERLPTEFQHRHVLTVAAGGRSNADAIAQGRIKNCENVVTAAVLADPTKGISWSGAGAKNGTDRNDTLLGNHRNNRLFGLAGDDVIWGDSVHSAGGTKAHDELDGGPGNDTIYGQLGP